jgi:hypothetical protein
VFVVCSMYHGRASPNTALIVKVVWVSPSFKGLDISVLVLRLPTKSKGVSWKRELQFENSTSCLCSKGGILKLSMKNWVLS